MARILCIGDAALDVIVHMNHDVHYGSDTPSTISMHGGGGAANTATWLAELGHSVFFSFRMGDDAAGQAISREFDFWNIEYRKNFIENEKTGIVVVLVDKTGERTMFPDSGANSGLSEKDLPDLAGFDAAFLSGYSLFNPRSTEGVLKMIHAIRQEGIPLFFDPASVGTMSVFGRDRILEFLPLMDALIMNQSEARFISQSENLSESLAFLTKLTPTVVIKMGSAGAIAQQRNNPEVDCPIEEIVPRDTTGAGDAFAAGFIPQWLANGDLFDSISAGNEIARRCVAIIGARPSVNPQ